MASVPRLLSQAEVEVGCDWPAHNYPAFPRPALCLARLVRAENSASRPPVDRPPRAWKG